MKLFYKPGACSLAAHIILTEIDAVFELVKVDTSAGLIEANENYVNINPKGYVPALQLGSGEVLTEGVSILQYIADRYPEHALAPDVGTIQRARLHEYLSYTGSELQQAFSPFFSGTPSEERKQKAGENVASKFTYLNSLLSDGRSYLLGDSFTVADAYLFVVSNWSNFVGIDLEKWPHVAAYVARVGQRPATQAAMKREGLIQ